MKKTIAFFFGLFLVSTSLYAGESSLIFKDSSSFQIARSLKLGHAMGEMGKPNKSGVEKGGLCESDADCSSSEKCKGNTCVNVCDPNPCSSGYCLDEGNHSYSCVECLNDDHCSADKKCSGNVCVDVCTGNNCTQQSKLCSSNGNHGYLCYGCTSDAACANDEFCDTTTKTCRTLCPDSCEGNLICEIIGAHEAKCSCQTDEDCPEGYTCDQETKQCVAADCGSLLMANGYGAAKDMETLKTAVASNVSEIGILESFTIGESVNLNGKKLIPANKYTEFAQCKALPQPTLTIADALNASGGSFEDMTLNLKAAKSSKFFSVKFFTDSVNFKNVTLNYTTDNWAYLFDVTGGTVNFDGTNTIKANTNADVNSGHSYFRGNSKVNINGALTVTGNPAATWEFEASTLTVAKTGKYTYKAGGNQEIIELSKSSKAIFNGPVVIQPGKGNRGYDSAYHGIYGSQGASIEFNASGNIIEAYNTGIYISTSDKFTTKLKINGSLTINMKNSKSDSGQHAIEAWGGNYGNKTKFQIDINAPVTVTGLHSYSGEYEISKADFLFYIFDTTINLNSTVTTNNGIAKFYRNNLNMGSGGAILGVSKYHNEGSGTTKYSSGAKLKIGGVCKKAVKAQTFTGSSQKYYTISVTSANKLGSPFTGGC